MNDTALVSITSQGQITIPVKFRKKLGFVSGFKAIARINNNSLVLEKPADLMSMAKSLKVANKTKSKNIDEIINAENEGLADAVADRYMQKEKRSTGELYIV